MIRISQEGRLRAVAVLKFVTRTLGVASILVGIAFKLPAEQVEILSQKNWLAAQLFTNLWWVMPLVLVLLPVTEAFRRWVEKQTLWPLVKAVLEDFKARLYPTSKGDPAFAHRITLFRYCKWTVRWRAIREMGLGWVRIVERTGHTTQNSRTVFRAPNDPDRAEGMAGSTWVANQLLFVEHLPDLSASNWESKAPKYAADTKCSLEEIKRRRPKSRSMCGIPVEVKGRVWGVLVIDSRDSTLPRAEIEAHYQMAAKYLSRLLERL